MELGNLGVLPIALYPELRICAMSFEQVSTSVTNPYYKKKGNKYAGQRGPDQSKIWTEVEKELADDEHQIELFPTKEPRPH
jgi:dCTP deaminase